MIIDHIPDKIETERLILRPLDWEDMGPFTTFLADPDTTRYMPFTDAKKSFEGASALLKHVIDSYKTDTPSFSLAIADKKTDAYIGLCGLHALEEDNSYEVYYMVLPARQGQGIATEAMRALLDYAVEHLAATKLVAYVFEENRAACRVAEKVGFHYGRRVKHSLYTGRLLVWEKQG